MITGAEAGRFDASREISDNVTQVSKEVFESARPMPGGNIYANANKAIDHFLAHGPGAEQIPGPRLHSGSRLPAELIRKTGEVLRRHGLFPRRGYAAAQT